jgi:hypothetical protein
MLADGPCKRHRYTVQAAGSAAVVQWCLGCLVPVSLQCILLLEPASRSESRVSLANCHHKPTSASSLGRIRSLARILPRQRGVERVLGTVVIERLRLQWAWRSRADIGGWPATTLSMQRLRAVRSLVSPPRGTWSVRRTWPIHVGPPCYPPPPFPPAHKPSRRTYRHTTLLTRLLSHTHTHARLPILPHDVRLKLLCPVWVPFIPYRT